MGFRFFTLFLNKLFYIKYLLQKIFFCLLVLLAGLHRFCCAVSTFGKMLDVVHQNFIYNNK